MKNDAELEEQLTLYFKIDMRNLTKFDPSTQTSQNLHLGSFWTKYIMFELKKYRGVIFYENEKWKKIWRKTELWFKKWHEKHGKSPTEHSEVWNLGLRWDPFIKSGKCMSLKYSEELCVMTMTDNPRFEEELTCCQLTELTP